MYYSYIGYGLAGISMILFVMSSVTFVRIKMGLISNVGFGDIASMLGMVFSLLLLVTTLLPIVIMNRPDISGILGVTMALLIFMFGPDSRVVALILMVFHLLLCYYLYIR